MSSNIAKIQPFSAFRSASTHLNRPQQELEKTAKRAFEQIGEQEGRQRISWKTVVALSLTEKSTVCARRLLQILPTFGVSKTGATLGSTICGTLSSGVGILLGGTVALGDGTMDLRRSFQIHDLEGKKQAALQMSSGIVSIPASAFSIVQQIDPGAFFGLSTVAGVFSAVGALFSLGIASRNIYLAGSFRSHLNQILHAKGETEQENLFHALQFLKEKIAPTRKEREEITREVEKQHPDWSPAAKQAEVEQKLFDLAEVKIRYMERRTSRDAIHRLLNDLNTSLERLNPASKAAVQDLQKANELIKAVQQGNKRKILISVAIVIASALAVSAIIIGTFFSLGVLPLVLYAISAAIGLLMLVYSLLALGIKGEDRVASIRRMIIETTPIRE